MFLPEDARVPQIVTHRRVLGIAVPMMFAYLSTALVGIVSTAAVGRLADPVLSAGIALAAVLFDVLFNSLSFLRSATLGLTALALGGGDEAEARAVYQRALLLALGLGGVILLLRPIEVSLGLRLLGAEGRVFATAQSYVLLRALSAPAALANYAILGALLGRGRAGMGLVLQLLLNGTNIVICAGAVLGLGWGVRGVALAAVAGELVALVAGLVLMHRLSGSFGTGLGAALRNATGWRRMGVLNRDILIRSLALLFAFAFFTREGTAFGAVILAANAIHMQFFSLSSNCLDGFAAAAEQLVGTMLGAGDRSGFRRAVRVSLGWSLVSGLIITILYGLFGPGFVAVLTAAPAVRLAAGHSLLWAALMPLVAAAAFQLDGVFIGATWSRAMRDMMLLSLGVFLVAWAILTPALGNDGLWIAFLIFLGMRGLTLGWTLRRRMREQWQPALVS
jgi:MATE family multidrug resistance protein